MISAADYLFPQNLSVSPSNLKRVLFVGSCMSGDYVNHIAQNNKEIEFEHLLFNHVSKLPDHPSRSLEEYDLQVVQLPLRHIIGDRIIRFDEFAKFNEDINNDAITLLRLMLNEALAYNDRNKLLTIVTNFIVPQADFVAAAENIGSRFDLRALVVRLNQEISTIISGRPNVFLLDVESIASSIGKRYFLDDFISIATHGGFWFPDWSDIESDRLEVVPHIESISPSHFAQFIDAVWQKIVGIWRTANQIDQVKLVIFDLDDTMWRGIIGEHYGDVIQRLTVGWPYGMQEIVHHLKARGILTAVCSKNSVDLVRERWDRAVAEGYLTLDEFTFIEINWQPKVESVGRILQAANLTPKSVVFVDDNPVERQSVLAAYPEIRVLPAEPFATRRILLNAPETQIPRITRETARREEMIQKMQVRQAASVSMSRDEFLASLNCKVNLFEIQSLEDDRFPRIIELVNKTNQFNTTGDRWKIEDFSKFLVDGGEVFGFDVVDRYTSYGIVGVIFLKNTHFVQFVMSCRVLGLDIETSVMREIIHSKLKSAAGFKKFSATLKITKQNAPCRNLYDKLGFVRETHNQELLWLTERPSVLVQSHIAVHSSISTNKKLEESNIYIDHCESLPLDPISKYILERNVLILSSIVAKLFKVRLQAMGFDEVYYLDCHVDVAKAGVDALDHFILHGRKEGRRFRLGPSRLTRPSPNAHN